MNGVLLGIGFLTRVPIPTRAPGPGDWGRAMFGFPLAGVLVAAACLFAQLLGAALWTPAVSAVLAVIAWAWITGALHLDGVADCLDGLGCNGDRERVLQVMHDPRAGAIGAVGTALHLALKIALVAACVEVGTGAAAIWAACVLARAGLPFEIAFGRPATPGRGLFAWLQPEVRAGHALAAAALAAALVGPALLVVPAAATGVLVGVPVAAAVSVAWAAAWRARIGGATGDVLGAAVELRELVLLAACATPALAAPLASGGGAPL
jgi:adenosylcobinamide-GDP ribazoletransferase